MLIKITAISRCALLECHVSGQKTGRPQNKKGQNQCAMYERWLSQLYDYVRN